MQIPTLKVIHYSLYKYYEIGKDIIDKTQRFLYISTLRGVWRRQS